MAFVYDLLTDAENFDAVVTSVRALGRALPGLIASADLSFDEMVAAPRTRRLITEAISKVQGASA